jgi:hypothetical protein
MLGLELMGKAAQDVHGSWCTCRLAVRSTAVDAGTAGKDTHAALLHIYKTTGYLSLNSLLIYMLAVG